MSPTITDLFCGAGGSSLGAELAGGTLRLGLNHWERAIETHATNFQHADHDCADVSALTTSQIRRYPDSDILLASPECTNHSLAKGARRRKPQASSLFDDGPGGADEQDRSRATMWDVVRFAEQKILRGRPYKGIVVENVVDAYKWGYHDDGGLFRAWLQAMKALGYEHEIVWLNSMFCPPTPQSRDRMYVVFWRRGIRHPNLRVEPPSWCPRCERVVAGRQSFKQIRRRSTRPVGKRDPAHAQRQPGAFPAATAIDWALPAERIGARRKPLAAATASSTCTRARNAAAPCCPRPLTLPLVTLTQRHDLAVVLPVAGNTFESTPGNRARRPDRQPMDTVHGTLDRALVVPPMGGVIPRDADLHPSPTQTTTTRAAVVQTSRSYRGHEAPRVRPVEAPLAAITGDADRALVVANRANNVPRPAEQPTHPVLTGSQLGVVHLRQHETVRRVEEPIGTVSAGGGHHGVVVAHYDPGWARDAVEEPFGTVTARDHHSLVVPYTRTGNAADADGGPSPTLTARDRLALVVPAGGTWREEASPAHEPHPTQTSREAFALAWGDEDIDECLFRMFALHEIADTMVMRWHTNGAEYVVLGNKRERMAQYGNAVTPPAMTLFVGSLVEVL